MRPLTQKSFYGKASIETENNISLLKSYDTIVAKYDHLNNKMEVFGLYSNTTMRHINSFLNHFGFDTCSKKELEEYYLSI